MPKNMFQLDDLLPLGHQKRKKPFDEIAENPEQMEDIEEMPEEKPRTRLADRYKEHLTGMPNQADYKPSTGTKLLGALVAGLSASDDRTKLTDAITGGRNIIDDKFNRATKAWQTKGKHEETLADLEDKDFDNDMDQRKSDLDVDKFKLDLDEFDVRSSDIGADNSLNREKFEHDGEKFEHEKGQDKERNKIDWHNANTNRQNADSLSTKAAAYSAKQRGTGDLAERASALSDLQSKVSRMREILQTKGDKVLGYKGEFNAASGEGVAGTVGQMMSKAGLNNTDADAMEYNRLRNEFMAHRGFKEGGKALTGPELKIFQAILPGFQNGSKEDQLRALDSFEQHIGQMLSDPHSSNNPDQAPNGTPDNDALLAIIRGARGGK